MVDILRNQFFTVKEGSLDYNFLLNHSVKIRGIKMYLLLELVEFVGIAFVDIKTALGNEIKLSVTD